MTIHTRLVIAAVATAVIFCTQRAPAQQRTTFASSVNAVRIDALATDSGKPIAKLTAADFELTDNGVVQQLSIVSGDTTPLDIFLAFDTSGSLTPERLQALAAAARALVGGLRAQDRVALVTFDHRVVLRSRLTRDATQLTRNLADITPSGGTSMLDAAFLSLSLHDAEPGRALLILFGDGVDTTSWLTEAKVLDAARHSDIVAFPVAPYDKARHDRPNAFSTMFNAVYLNSFMSELTKETGGRVLEADPKGDMRKVFADIVEEFQNRYLLAYVPTGVSSTGWHDVTVKLKKRKGSVTARRGYFAK